MRRAAACIVLASTLLCAVGSISEAGASSGTPGIGNAVARGEVIVYRVAVAEPYEGTVRRSVRSWQGVDGEGPGGYGVRWVRAEKTERPLTLIIRTVCENSGTLGRFSDPDDPDTIELNRCAMAGSGEKLKGKVMTHEAGHALGVPHPRVTEYQRNHAVMYLGPNARLFQRPQSSDRAAYRRLWGP